MLIGSLKKLPMMNSWDDAFLELNTALVEEFSIKAVFHLSEGDRQIDILSDAETKTHSSKYSSIDQIENSFEVVELDAFDIVKGIQFTMNDQLFEVTKKVLVATGVYRIYFSTKSTGGNHRWTS